MSDYHRQILTCLRDEYGVKIGRDDIQNGGSHSYLEFDYAGKRRRLTLQRAPGAGASTVALKIQDIRRDLGPPIKPNDRPRRKMEDMMPTIPLKKDFTARGSVSNYERNGCLCFMFSQEVADRLDVNTRYKVVKTGDDIWEISPGGSNALRRIAKSDVWRIAVGAKTNGLAGDLGYFNRYPTDYVVIDGHILASIVERKTLGVRQRREKKPLTAKHVQKLMIQSVAEDIQPTDSSTVPRMRSFLAELAKLNPELTRLEAQGPYRLIRTKEGKWKFQAPSIALEDEE